MTKSIIVTGGSKGLGLAIVRSLLEHDLVKVISISRSRTKDVDQLEKQYNERYRHIEGDVIDSVTAEKAIEHCLSSGSLDGVIFNAGVIEPIRKIGAGDNGQNTGKGLLDGWRALYEINVFSIISMLEQVAAPLRASNGRVIFVSSGAAAKSYVGWGAYGSSKAALNHICKSFAVEEPHIIFMSIAPGVVATDMQALIRSTGESHMSPEEYAKFTGLHQTGGLLPPEKPAGVIANLILNGPKSLSGRFFEWNSDEAQQAIA